MGNETVLLAEVVARLTGLVYFAIVLIILVTAGIVILGTKK